MIPSAGQRAANTSSPPAGRNLTQYSICTHTHYSQIPIPSTTLLPRSAAPASTTTRPRSSLTRVRPRPFLQPTPATDLPTHRRSRLHGDVLPAYPTWLPACRQGAPSPPLGWRQPILQEPPTPRSSRRRRPTPAAQANHLQQHPLRQARHHPLDGPRRPRQGLPTLTRCWSAPTVDHKPSCGSPPSEEVCLTMELDRRKARVLDSRTGG